MCEVEGVRGGGCEVLQAAVQGVPGGGCQGRALWVQVFRVIGAKSAGGRACGASEAQWRVLEWSAQPPPPPQSACSSGASDTEEDMEESSAETHGGSFMRKCR